MYITHTVYICIYTTCKKYLEINTVARASKKVSFEIKKLFTALKSKKDINILQN